VRLPERPLGDVRLENRALLRHIAGMSFAEMKELLPTLSSEERVELLECIQALGEGISVQELRAMNAALDEELNDPSPTVSIAEVYKDLENLTRNNAASA
jgi:hypothetical protein